MDTITKIRSLAAKNIKSIVLPEYNDPRVKEACRIINEEGIARATLFTPEMIDDNQKEHYASQFYEAYKGKDVDMEGARRLFSDTLYYSTMMVKEGQFDGFVAGAVHTSSDVIRSCMRCIGIDEKVTIISSCFIMVVPDCNYGESGTLSLRIALLYLSLMQGSCQG